eukprot:3096108-Pyramimonas_sp.AAC.1
MKAQIHDGVIRALQANHTMTAFVEAEGNRRQLARTVASRRPNLLSLELQTGLATPEVRHQRHWWATELASSLAAGSDLQIQGTSVRSSFGQRGNRV